MAITPEYLTTRLNKLLAGMSTALFCPLVIFHMDLLAFNGTFGHSFHITTNPQTAFVFKKLKSLVGPVFTPKEPKQISKLHNS